MFKVSLRGYSLHFQFSTTMYLKNGCSQSKTERNSDTLITYIRCTFDLVKAIAGLLGALVSKCPVSRKWVVIKWAEWNSGHQLQTCTNMGYIWPGSAQGHFWIIQCPGLKMAGDSKKAAHRAKWIGSWESGTLAQHIWGDCVPPVSGYKVHWLYFLSKQGNFGL